MKFIEEGQKWVKISENGRQALKMSSGLTGARLNVRRGITGVVDA